MGLSTFQTRTVKVPFNVEEPEGNGITIRALNLDDCTTLVSNHLGEIAMALELYEAHRADLFKEASLDKFVLAMISVVPSMAGELIAVAADEPELADIARKLAVGTQLHAITEISRLTLEDSGGIKNLFAALANVLPVLPQIARTRNLLAATSNPSTES